MNTMSDELMPVNAVASVVSPRVLATTKEIDIPDVQRGLVWNPTQIAELWKSILDGYPIGALTVYRQDKNWQLIDGQQRWHAIKLGLHPDEEQKAMTILWTVWEKKKGEPWNFVHLMVSTRRHPWGFVWNKPGDHLKRLPHPKMIEAWDNMLPNEQREDSFELPTLKKAQDYLKDNRTHKWIPLHELLSEGDTPGDSDVQTIKWIPLHELLSEGDTPGDSDVQTIRSSAQVVTWRKRVESPFIPLIRFNLQENVKADQNQENVKSDRNQENVKADRNRIHELFTRINKGGTQISSVDYTYSTLCSYLGKDFKKGINEIARDFMPPNRVARLYARLKYARLKYAKEEGKESPSLLREPPHSSYWNGKEYDAEIGTAIAAAKSMYSSNGIPQTVYLQASGDEWLTVVTWCMLIFSDIIQGGDPSHQTLLCMLPYVVCRDPGYHEHFCNRFYEALNDANRFYEALKDATPPSLMELLAIGVAYSACYSIETGMYPITELKETIELQQEYPYDKEWLHVLCDSKNEPLLHFLQRSYMNKMLQKRCGFYPHETATWGEDMNRPWDDDHIVPQSRWWGLQQEEPMFRDSLPNKQMLYYRLNRKKKDYYIGVPADDGISPESLEDYFCYSGAEKRKIEIETKTETYFGWDNAKVYDRRPARLHQNTVVKNRAPYEGCLTTYKVVVNKRFSTMIQRLFDYLPLVDLIRAINNLPNAKLEELPCLRLPIALWNVLEDNMALTWCSVRHDQSKQQVIETKDFYHSLCHWLAVGKEENNAFTCVCWHLTDAETLHKEEGRRRLPNQTLAEWKNGASQDAPRNDWWVENGFSALTLTKDLGEIQKKLKDISA